MNQEDLLQFIKVNSDDLDFTGGVDESKVKSIETNLNVNLPNSYKWFLHNFGMGGIFGVEILGFGKATPASVVTQTERYRKLGLPSDYVVISRLFDSRTGEALITAAGIGHFGTQSAGEFLTNPAYMEQVVRGAPRDWHDRNMQLVLRAEVIGRTPGPPKVVASWFW
jgi:hypothetical protein